MKRIDHLIRSMVSFLALLILTGSLHAQSKDEKDSFSLQIPDKAANEIFLKTNSYYVAIEKLLESEKDFQGNPMRKDFYYQALATDLSIAGQYIAALKAMNKLGYEPQRSPVAIDLKENVPVNALEEIERLASKHRAVFVNEAHHVAKHRAFTHQLLQRLYRKGYRYFAAETLMLEDTTFIRHKNYMAAYINEPEYADLIRAAVNIGYQIIPYEMVTERIFIDDQEEDTHILELPGEEEETYDIRAFDEEGQKREMAKRETAQATNLKQKIFDKDPNAKVLVHAGYDHIMEEELAGYSMMAARFKAMTGIDPLTIDQVDMMEQGAFNLSSGHFQYVTNQVNPLVYTILKKKDGTYWTNEVRHGKVDMQVFHPKTTLKNGRPAWKALGGARKLKTIKIPKATKGMAEVFVVGEENGVPIDRLYLAEPTEQLNFYLPKGNFQLKVTNELGKLIYEVDIK